MCCVFKIENENFEALQKWNINQQLKLKIHLLKYYNSLIKTRDI